MNNYDLRVILFAHPRSGSSSLYQILQLHPALHILEEPFNENFADWNPAHKNYIKSIHDIPSLDIQLAEIFSSYNGIKVLDYQLRDDLAVHLLRQYNCKIIFLRRNNLLQSVVSTLLAKQTGLWKKWDMTLSLNEYYRDIRPLNVQEIQRHMTELKERLDFFESIIDALPIGVAIKLVYEDLYLTPLIHRDAQIRALWDFLQIAPLGSDQIRYYLEPDRVKINSSATYALIPNVDEIQQYCGNETTGWLYDT